MNNHDTESLADILNVEPYYMATNLAWDLSKDQKEQLTTGAMACLAGLLDGVGAVPVKDIPNPEMLLDLIAKGLVVDRTREVQQARMSTILAKGKTSEVPSVL